MCYRYTDILDPEEHTSVEQGFYFSYRKMWRSGVRSAMRAARQLSGRGPTDVDVAPVPARKSKI